MPFNPPPKDQITIWPPKDKKDKPRQATREELRRMQPDVVLAARDAGALVDIMLGKTDAAILEERGE